MAVADRVAVPAKLIGGAIEREAALPGRADIADVAPGPALIALRRILGTSN